MKRINGHRSPILDKYLGEEVTIVFINNVNTLANPKYKIKGKLEWISDIKSGKKLGMYYLQTNELEGKAGISFYKTHILKVFSSAHRKGEPV